MWIERVEFMGFGNLSGRAIEFSREQLNLVVETNEYGKSTIADAVLAVLYDFPSRQKNTDERLSERDARRPANPGPYKACVDVNTETRKLRIVRDFDAKTIKVFDRTAGDVDVTDEFCSSPTQDEVGLNLSGLTREMFRNTCFVGQGVLGENSLSNSLDLASLLQSIADSSGSATTSATAIGVIEDALSQFSFEGKKGKIDRFIKELEQRAEETRAELSRLRADHDAVAGQMENLRQIDRDLQDQEKSTRAAEYFHLVMEVADLDAKISKAQQRVVQVTDLQRQLKELNNYTSFPIERQKHVEEAWARRQSRLEDHLRLKKELDEKEKYYKARQLELRERWEGLSEFTADDAQAISGLSRALQNATTELNEAKTKRESEKERVKESGLDLSSFADVRKTMLNLDAKEVDDAYAYNAMIRDAKERITDCERSVWRSQTIKTEIEEQRKTAQRSWKGTLTALVLSFMILGCVVAASFAMKATLGEGIFYVGVGLLSSVLVAIVAVTVLMGTAKNKRAGDYQKAQEEEDKLAATGQEMHTKIMGLQVRLEDLARKVGLPNGEELIKQVQAYGTAAAQLKELDIIDQVIASRESHIIKLKDELESYFKKAGRSTLGITPDNASKLAAEINMYLDEARTFESSAGLLDHKQSELKFLSDEVRDLDTLLREHFTQAKSGDADQIETGYKSFCQAVSSYRRLESLQSELNRIAQDPTSDMQADELPKGIEKLESQRSNVWARMEDLVRRFPKITETPPPMLDAAGSPHAAAEALDAMRSERENLSVMVRASTHEYDDKYLVLEGELESTEKKLACLLRTKAALELAGSTFRKMSEETHVSWSSGLNDISRNMLQTLDLEFESIHFDKDLRMTARKKGESEPLQPAQISSQLSVGTREQLHWLARLAVARFLAQDNPVPLILDEPFAETDDERFLKMMRFLLDVVLPNHQVILFSCHKQRHDWLSDQLGEAAQRITQPALQPLTVPANT